MRLRKLLMKIKNALKRFAYETFRPHSREEYAELFSRGHGGDKKTPYPWFYARVLLISLLLFTVLCLSYSVSDLNFLMVAAAGAFFADVTFIVLLVEIYPKRDLSLLTPIAVLFAGGIISSSFIYILYGIHSTNVPFADQAWTAFVEETGKVLATIIILALLKKRDPFVCFIVGAAVGGGYSAFENMWYMYTHGFAWGGGLSQAIQTGLWRALGTPFSHAAWAGAFGWALSGVKPWRKWKPYAIYVFNYVMHFFVNFPLMSQFAGWKGYPISAVTGVLSVTLIIFIIIRCRRALVTDYTPLELPVFSQRRDGFPKINGSYVQPASNTYEYPAEYSQVSRYALIANILAAAAIFCFSFMLLGPTCVFGGYMNYKEYYYNNWEEVLKIVQEDRIFEPDYNREYEDYELSENFAYTWTDGELISVTQRQLYGNYYYRFTYGYGVYYIGAYDIFEDGDGNLFVQINGNNYPIEAKDGILPQSVRVWELKSVALELNGAIYYPRTIFYYGNGHYNFYSASSRQSDDYEGPEIYRYFLLNPKVSYVGMPSDGVFEVDLYESVPVKETESVVFTVIFFAAFTGCGIAYFIYKSKIRRLKNAE